jgi:hypothetical protein
MKEEYEKPSVTVDMVVFTVSEGELKVLLVKRYAKNFFCMKI